MKGQISQTFIYIMAVIVFAVILIFGYRAISTVIAKGETVAFGQFKIDLEDAILRIYSSFQSVTIYNSQNPLQVPAKYKQVCFVDVDHEPPQNCESDLGVIACDSWQTYFDRSNPTQDFDAWEIAEANVFLDPPAPLPIKLHRFRVDSNEGYLCIPTKGLLQMRVEGKGGFALIGAIGP